MTPTIALVVILTIFCILPFFQMADLAEKTRAQANGGYVGKPTAHGFLMLLLLPTILALWWYYALAVDQILLGVIPTVGFTISTIVLMFETRLRRPSK